MTTTTSVSKDISQLAKLEVSDLLELADKGTITRGEMLDVISHQTALRNQREEQLRKEAEEAKAKANSAAGDGKKVKEVVSTKPGWVTVRYTGRGFPTSGSVATWEALLSYLEKNTDKMRSIVKAVRDVGSDDKAHKKLACYSAAKESR